MANLESDVRAVIVEAIEGIASDLGFDAEGNVHPYLLEWERDDSNAVVAYLMANVAGKKKVRAWGVQVLGKEVIEAASEVYRRTYEIEVVGYYGDKSEEGTPINSLIDHATKIRGAIKELSSRLSDTVDRISDNESLSISREKIADIGSVWRGRILYIADKYNPDW